MMGSSMAEGKLLGEIPEDMTEYLASLETVPRVLFMPYTRPEETDIEMYFQANF